MKAKNGIEVGELVEREEGWAGDGELDKLVGEFGGWLGASFFSGERLQSLEEVEENLTKKKQVVRQLSKER